MDASAIDAVVRELVLEVVQERQPDFSRVAGHELLHADLGLKSLELARIIAGLELTLELDPFADRVAITSIRTVSDLVSAYTDPASLGPDPSVDAGQRRARARKSAGDGSDAA